MGWNDARAHLVAPGWKVIVDLDPRARTVEGLLLRILNLEKEDRDRTGGIQSDGVRAWLEERGFRAVRDQEPSVRFVRNDIEVLFCMVRGELAGAVLTFTLSRNCPSQWRDWQAFADSFMKVGEFALYDVERGMMVPDTEILRVLSETQQWKEFEANFRWPRITEQFPG